MTSPPDEAIDSYVFDSLIDDTLLNLSREFEEIAQHSDEPIVQHPVAPDKATSDHHDPIHQDVSDCRKNENSLPHCMYCHSVSHLDASLMAIKYYICRSCLLEHRDSDHYRFISQSHGLKKFGLQLDELRHGSVYKDGKLFTVQLVVKEIANPRGYGAKMKLYYEFQLLQLALAKYGSMEKFTQEMHEREQNHLRRLLGDTCYVGRKKSLKKNTPEHSKTTRKRGFKHHPMTSPSATVGSSICYHPQMESLDPTEDCPKMLRQKCLDCGFIETWEEI